MTFSDIFIILPFSFSLWYLPLLPLPEEPYFLLSLIRSLIPCNPLYAFLSFFSFCICLPASSLKRTFTFPDQVTWTLLFPSLLLLNPSIHERFYFLVTAGYILISEDESLETPMREHVILCLSGSGLPLLVASFLVTFTYPKYLWLHISSWLGSIPQSLCTTCVSYFSHGLKNIEVVFISLLLWLG